MYFSDVQDTYRTVPLKLISAFYWLIKSADLKKSNLQWILKLDDDILLNLYSLETLLSQLNPTKSSIYCNYYSDGTPFIDSASKWFVSYDEYPYSLYPPYCQGALYLMNFQTLKTIYNLLEEEYHRNYIWVEDVLFTGIVFMIYTNLLKNLNFDKIYHFL